MESPNEIQRLRKAVFQNPGFKYEEMNRQSKIRLRNLREIGLISDAKPVNNDELNTSDEFRKSQLRKQLKSQGRNPPTSKYLRDEEIKLLLQSKKVPPHIVQRARVARPLIYQMGTSDKQMVHYKRIYGRRYKSGSQSVQAFCNRLSRNPVNDLHELVGDAKSLARNESMPALIRQKFSRQQQNQPDDRGFYRPETAFTNIVKSDPQIVVAPQVSTQQPFFQARTNGRTGNQLQPSDHSNHKFGECRICDIKATRGNRHKSTSSPQRAESPSTYQNEALHQVQSYGHLTQGDRFSMPQTTRTTQPILIGDHSKMVESLQGQSDFGRKVMTTAGTTNQNQFHGLKSSYPSEVRANSPIMKQNRLYLRKRQQEPYVVPGFQNGLQSNLLGFAKKPSRHPASFVSRKRQLMQRPVLLSKMAPARPNNLMSSEENSVDDFVTQGSIEERPIQQQTQMVMNLANGQIRNQKALVSKQSAEQSGDTHDKETCTDCAHEEWLRDHETNDESPRNYIKRYLVQCPTSQDSPQVSPIKTLLTNRSAMKYSQRERFASSFRVSPVRINRQTQ